MDKILSSQTRVRFQDCDPFNHLNNSKYIDYFINAREDQILDNYKINLFELAQMEKIGWVIGTNQVAYFYAAFPNEILTIQSQLFEYGDKFMSVEMLMWDEKQIKLKAVMWMRLVHIDLRGQNSIIHQKTFMDLFSSVLVPIKEKVFEQRVLNFKSQKVKV
jgi:thioesterase-3